MAYFSSQKLSFQTLYAPFSVQNIISDFNRLTGLCTL